MYSLFQPPSEARWRQVAEGFGERWNFPNCIGAVDGKHVQIFAPQNSGSEFFNYKVCSLLRHIVQILSILNVEYRAITGHALFPFTLAVTPMNMPSFCMQ